MHVKKVNVYYINLIPSPSLSSFHNLPHGEVDTKYLGGYHGYSIWKGNINIHEKNSCISSESSFLQGSQQMAGLGDLRGVFEPLADNYQQLCQLLHLLHQISTEEEQRPGLLAGDGDNGEMSSSRTLVSVRAVNG